MDHIVELLLGLTVLTILIVVAIYILTKIRESRTKNDSPSTRDLFVKFGQLYDAGVLTEEEFRAVKRTFAVALTMEPVGKTKKEDGAAAGDAIQSPAEIARAARLERLLRG